MFNEIQDPLDKFYDGYERNNPNILKHLESCLKKGRPFHYLFTGVVGCGKTYLARNIVKVTQMRWEVVKVKKHYSKYLEFLGGDYTDKWDAIRNLGNVVNSQCLVIDDLGNEKPGTEAAHDYFSGLVESRYDHLDGHLRSTRTVITTNLDSDELIDHYGSRLLDRIQERFIICKLNTTSFREKQSEVIAE